MIKIKSNWINDVPVSMAHIHIHIILLIGIRKTIKKNFFFSKPIFFQTGKKFWLLATLQITRALLRESSKDKKNWFFCQKSPAYSPLKEMINTDILLFYSKVSMHSSSTKIFVNSFGLWGSQRAGTKGPPCSSKFIYKNWYKINISYSLRYKNSSQHPEFLDGISCNFSFTQKGQCKFLTKRSAVMCCAPWTVLRLIYYNATLRR